MKKFKIALCFVLMIALFSITAFADDAPLVLGSGNADGTPENPFHYTGVVKEVISDNGNFLVTVESCNPDDVNKAIVFVTQKSDFNVGDYVTAAYGPEMTRSIPPQTTAYTIEKVNIIVMSAPETYKYTGYVRCITPAKEASLVLVESTDKNVVNKEIVFVIKNNRTKVGDLVEIVYGNVMTMSLPPQTKAIKVTIKKAAPVVSKNIYSGIIKSIGKADKSGNVVIFVKGNDKKQTYDAIRFVLSPKTQGIKVKSLKVGDKVTVEYGNLMSRSIPPQTNAIKIVKSK